MGSSSPLFPPTKNNHSGRPLPQQPTDERGESVGSTHLEAMRLNGAMAPDSSVKSKNWESHTLFVCCVAHSDGACVLRYVAFNSVERGNSCKKKKKAKPKVPKRALCFLSSLGKKNKNGDTITDNFKKTKLSAAFEPAREPSELLFDRQIRDAQNSGIAFKWLAASFSHLILASPSLASLFARTNLFLLAVRVLSSIQYAISNSAPSRACAHVLLLPR